MNQMTIWELWENEFKNAKRFFNTKGNIKTKSKYKDLWYSEFRNMLIEIQK